MVLLRTASTAFCALSLLHSASANDQTDLAKYESRVNNTLIDELLAYARTQLDGNLPSIRNNVKKLAKDNAAPPVLDVLWPGASFASTACGGQFEVLSLLEKAGVLKVGNLMGASGGATSALFALAGGETSSRGFLRSYDISAQFVKEHGFMPIIKQPSFFKAQYLAVVQDDQAFARACQQRGYVSLTVRKHDALGDQYALHNFSTRQQCADAYYASGEATAKGLATGDKIAGLDAKIGGAADGGSLTSFLKQPLTGKRRPAVYYHTFFDNKYLMELTPATITYLFKRGVDDTIAMLQTPKFVLDKDSKKEGGMVIAADGSFNTLQKLGYKLAEMATFLDAGSGVATESKN